ncbi:MAG: hypothetical protein P8L66_10235 [Rhodospirillaceae bacterium]|nr:hypothetical protein [Rhodospirillaceae bacterium]
MNQKTIPDKMTGIVANAGSFRDPVNRVYEVTSPDGNTRKRILRGVNQDALETYQELATQSFYKRLVEQGHIVKTDIAANDDSDALSIISEGWSGVLEHEAVPFISYPYEWTFTMLRDAALLQLYIIEESIENGWTLKDATPYNFQFVGPKAVFIDIPSFETRVEGEPWNGYRQFSSMFLIPLLMKSHLGIDQLPILRSYIDGVPPTEAIKYFKGLNRLKKGVISHITFPAMVENKIAVRERDGAPAKKRTVKGQSNAMVLGLVQSLSRLIKGLKSDIKHTDWSHYDKTHSYESEDFVVKKAFVQKYAALSAREHIWDIGCNTGTFSKICSPYCNLVVSLDGDHDAVEQLYLKEKEEKSSNILPLVMNLSNISPGQGWAGSERQAFDKRRDPDLVLCLALIHHIRMSANVPNVLFLKWLRSLNSDVVLEFVNREDEMVVKLLTNKKEQYADYDIEQFIREAELFFTIENREPLKDGKRELFFLKPI